MTFQVVIETSDRLIIGIGPFDAGTDFGPGYQILALDDSQQAAALAPTAYVCTDGATVEVEPC